MTMATRRTILKGGIALAALPALSGIALGQEKLKVGFAYLATIAVLVIISLRRSGNSGAPACLGKPFIPTA